jgi:hypothetical protein
MPGWRLIAALTAILTDDDPARRGTRRSGF